MLCSPPSLSDHIQFRFQGGIEISCLSDLPAGSGMGGSSILAATILASLCSLFELKVSHALLMDYVSYTEQILTTGGG
ncbi:hypothetical protein, partial [Klebsiella pneumoniae]|uniref:GHMP family kinase ATP-binding protein n=1 Tax=Klebsiella pneumoniae TaxID=573 RepID=UPI003305750A